MLKVFRASRIWLACTLSFTACQDSPFFHQYSSVSREGWDSDMPVVFEIKDSLIRKDMPVQIELRHTKDYRFKDITLVATAETEGKCVWEDTVNMELFDEKGKTTGTGLPYISNGMQAKSISLEKGKIYTFRIKHVMRCNPLDGITDIGLRIDHPSH